MSADAAIVILDHGMGNLGSVLNAFRFLGVDAVVSADPHRLRQAERLVVPGQGAFGDCCASVSGGLDEVIVEFIASGRPFLGICIGLQLLFESSDESAGTPGLAVLNGSVERFPVVADGGPRKVPHMGWNAADLQREHALFAGIGDHAYFYFVHSYVVKPAEGDLVLARTNYGVPFVSAVARDNLFACQFHPEKSQRVGLKLLENFVNWSPA